MDIPNDQLQNLNLESSFQQSGHTAYDQGYSEGFQASYQQGFDFGLIKGEELAIEFAKILGFAEALIEEMNEEKIKIKEQNQNSTKISRIVKTCEKLKTQILEFENIVPGEEIFSNKVEAIRALFKTVHVLSKKITRYAERMGDFVVEIENLNRENNELIKQQIAI